MIKAENWKILAFGHTFATLSFSACFGLIRMILAFGFTFATLSSGGRQWNRPWLCICASVHDLVSGIWLIFAFFPSRDVDALIRCLSNGPTENNFESMSTFQSKRVHLRADRSLFWIDCVAATRDSSLVVSSAQKIKDLIRKCR
jgi:hypothetical protein